MALLAPEHPSPLPEHSAIIEATNAQKSLRVVSPGRRYLLAVCASAISGFDH